MAESILYDLVGNIITKLGSSACRELKLMWGGVDDELKELQGTLSTLKAVLLDAEEKQSNDPTVKDWVSKLKDVLYEIDDFIDECSYESLRRQVLAKDGRNTKQVCTLFSKFQSNMKMGHQIKEIWQRLKVINDDKTQFSIKVINDDKTQSSILDTGNDELSRETHSFILEKEVIGRNHDKDKVIILLLNSNTNECDLEVISIVGMGGLGKTTLAQSVYNDNRTTTHFELKLWVCVSEEFVVKIIVQKMIESATGKIPESSFQLDSLQKELKRQIDGKKYLLVMDDVWNENREKWVSLKQLLMGGAKGSRILITTRSEQVAKTFNTHSLHSLQHLDECSSWLLFKKITDLDKQVGELENSNLVEIGKEIVTKLKGNPLAIRTVGGLLYCKKSQRFWMSFKDEELYRVMGQKNLEDIRSILELSYKHLPANLKQCFLYCALFPKDYSINKNELILQWRAQGFIQPNDIDIGDDCFMELLSRSFFQEVQKDFFGIETCKMHDLMHDLACSITGNECVHGLGNDIDRRTHHFSLGSISSDESKEVPKTLSEARNLRTFFMLKDSNYEVDWKLDYEKCFHDHLRFRTLHLNGDGMDLSVQICKLKHLRYLRIDGWDIEYFPNCITELYNLETLLITNWRELKELPSDIKNLMNLKHLDLFWNWNLEFIPDSITQLNNLETLRLSRCTKLRELPRDIKKLINLKHLDLSRNENLEFLPDSITQLNNLETLRLSMCTKLRELPRDIKKLINLEHLDLDGCKSLSHMPKGLGELTNLQTLNKFVLGKKDNNGGGLSELNGLNKLRGSLSIEGLEFCTTVDLQANAKFLQRKSELQKLKLRWGDNSCNEATIGELEDLDERVLDCLQPHSNLREMFMSGYKGVKLCNWVSPNSLRCLVFIWLYGCGRLKHLSQLHQLPKLKTLYLLKLPSIEYIIGNEDAFVSSSTLYFPSLETLWIDGMPRLKGWWKLDTTTSMESPEGSFPINFPCLSQLEISVSSLHILCMSWHAPLLTSLNIRDSKDKLDEVQWTNFENLSSLSLTKLSKLLYLPIGLQHVTTLQTLTLWSCENLKSLSEWIDQLTSLTKLEIFNCEKLTSLPERIRHIPCLQSLCIGKCPILEERCKKDTGEDWHKIAHIPDISSDVNKLRRRNRC